MASNNMYRVGDFVYFEATAAAPYQIRRIEELSKTSTGAVEAKVVCFYRRKDLPQNLVNLADNNQSGPEVFASHLPPHQLNQIKHRELFISRQIETLPATHIRGKCFVSLHTDTEPCLSYLNKDDTFFFQLVYDPVQKTLQGDRGSIRVGEQFQANIPTFEEGKVTEKETSDSTLEVREELIWRPCSSLTSADVDTFIVLARSLGTLGRAYYPPATLRQPNLVNSAASASRDSTHQHALNTLHKAEYDTIKALQLLAPNGQPVLKLDEMEEWSASEGNLFEEALDKYGKCFSDIQSDFLPWKHPKSLVAFYYMWKTTDHYVQQKKLKAAEIEHRLKQVYIPNYNKPNPAVLYPPAGSPTAPLVQPSNCECCLTPSSSQWYAVTTVPGAPIKVCTACWNYWKRYGETKSTKSVAAVNNGQKVVGSTSIVNNNGPMKSRSASFFLNTSNAVRIARRLLPKITRARSTARRPCYDFDRKAASNSQPVAVSTETTDEISSSAFLLLKQNAMPMMTQLSCTQINCYLKHCLRGISKPVESADCVPENLSHHVCPKRPPRRVGDKNVGTDRLIKLADKLSRKKRPSNTVAGQDEVDGKFSIPVPSEIANLFKNFDKTIDKNQKDKQFSCPTSKEADAPTIAGLIKPFGDAINSSDSKETNVSRKRPASDFLDAKTAESGKRSIEDAVKNVTAVRGDGTIDDSQSSELDVAKSNEVLHSHVSRTAAIPEGSRPKRRRIDGLDAGTHLFVAHDAVKKHRRLSTSSAQLRRLSRCPWTPKDDLLTDSSKRTSGEIAKRPSSIYSTSSASTTKDLGESINGSTLPKGEKSPLSLKTLKLTTAAKEAAALAASANANGVNK